MASELLDVDSVIDEASGLRFFRQLEGQPTATAQEGLRRICTHLAREAREPGLQLRLLDRVRRHLVAGQVALQESLDTRPLPLSLTERRRIEDWLELHELLGEALLVLLPGTTGEDAGELRTGVLLRMLDTTSRPLQLLLRLRQAPPESLWAKHCRQAEVMVGLRGLDLSIDDALNPVGKSHARELIATPLLLALVRPWSVPAAHQRLVRLCLRAWSGRVGLRVDQRAAASAALPGPALDPPGLYRVWLDTRRLLPSLQRRIARLLAGETPQQAGFQIDLSRAEALACLQNLEDRWSLVDPVSLPRPDVGAIPVGVLLGGGISAPQAAMGEAEPRIALDQVTNLGLPRSRLDHLFETAEAWRLAPEGYPFGHFTRVVSTPRLQFGDWVVRRETASAESVFLGQVSGLWQEAKGQSTLVWVNWLPQAAELHRWSTGEGVFLDAWTFRSKAGQQQLLAGSGRLRTGMQLMREADSQRRVWRVVEQASVGPGLERFMLQSPEPTPARAEKSE